MIAEILKELPKLQKCDIEEIFDLTSRILKNPSYWAHKAKIHKHLGGKCAHCGTIKNLQIDHVDPWKKNFDPISMQCALWEEVMKELELCQLLCEPCHKIKSKTDGSVAKGLKNRPKAKHGSYTRYRIYKCRCEQCREASNAYWRESKRQKRSNIRGVTGIERL